MAGLTHISLQAFERRAREGRVTTRVPADVEVVVALIRVARAARVLANGVGDEQDEMGAREQVRSALASVPPETA